MKKVFCMVMALVLLLPINSLGFEGRVDDEMGVQSCSHANTYVESIVPLSYAQYSSTKHTVYAEQVISCNDCGAVMFRDISYKESHDCNAKGSCNSTTTTIDYICACCNYLTQRITYPCRGVSCIYPHDTISSADTTAFCCEHQHSHGSRG